MLCFFTVGQPVNHTSKLCALSYSLKKLPVTITTGWLRVACTPVAARHAA